MIGRQLNDGSCRHCLMLNVRDEKLVTERYPDLQQTLSMHAAAYYGDTVYVAGGQRSTQSTSALRLFMTLRLGGSAWQLLPDLPVTGRILPVLIACAAGVFLISGVELTGDPGPPAGRRFLADAHGYREHSGWTALAAPPRPMQAAPVLFWKATLLIFGGNDGTYATREFEVRDHHPGLSKEVVAYDIASNCWSLAGALPISLATTNAAIRDGEFVIPGGEDRPGPRSAPVLAGPFT